MLPLTEGLFDQSDESELMWKSFWASTEMETFSFICEEMQNNLKWVRI